MRYHYTTPVRRNHFINTAASAQPALLNGK